jgi:DNA polymerase II
MIKKEHHRTSYLELEFEHVFVKFLMPTIRGSETGAKKRYAGIIVKDGKEDMEFTGLEAVRSDWTDLAKEFQTTLLRKIFDGKDPGKYVREIVDELRAGKLDDKLVYRKRVRKELENYTKTTPPHVKAARLLEKRTKSPITSNVIHYLMTEKGPEPQGYVEAKLDYEHYIEKQLRPIADSILSFQGKKLADFLKGSQQKGLGDF